MGVGSPAPVRGAEVGEPQLAAMAGRSAFNLVVDRQAGGALSAERLLSTLRQLVSICATLRINAHPTSYLRIPITRALTDPLLS